RAAPSTTAGVIAGLTQGTAVAILDTQGNWDHVEVVISGGTSRQGWAYGSYIGATSKSPAARPLTGR
ncbi:MAG TPA: SH3 domain-containing protein, partial [Rhizomicrobium sp.]|nr:SH3 domain-containing protein [Rhizomicrobium sp.]